MLVEAHEARLRGTYILSVKRRIRKIEKGNEELTVTIPLNNKFMLYKWM